MWLAAHQPLVVPLVVLAVTAAAALLRLVGLTDIPPGLHGDEAITAMESRRILDEGPIGPWSPSIHGQPAGPFYWVAFWFLFLPETHFTVRLTAALLGIAAVPVFYLFTRELFGTRAALIGTFVLAFSYWAVHFSRTAFPLSALPVIATAALYFLVHGARRERLWAFAMGGAFLGAGIYTYGSYPFFFLALPAPVALFLWQSREDAEVLRRRLLGVVLAGCAALVVAGRYLVFAAQNPEAVLHASAVVRITETQAFQEASLWEQLVILAGRSAYALSVYFHGFQVDPVDALGLRGLLDPVAAVLFVVGLAVAVARIRDWRYALLPFGVLAGAVPVVLLTPSHVEGGLWAEYRRNIIALPFVFAAVGVGGAAVLAAAGRWMPDRRRAAIAVTSAALAVALVVGAGINVHHYFWTWARDGQSRWVFVHELVAALEYVKTIEAEGLTVYFYSSRWSYDYPTRQFLLPEVEGEDRSEEFGTFRLEDDADGAAVYLFLRDYLQYAPLVVQEYPGGEYFEGRDEDGRLLFIAYHLPDGPGPSEEMAEGPADPTPEAAPM